MKTPMTDTKKWLIGGTITAIIILLIIWYRNVQKNKAAELAKSKLVSGNTGAVPVTASNIGKTALVNNIKTVFYTTDGKFDQAYTKTTLGEFAGSIIADQTDSGNTSFYKVTNSTGTKLYVLKSQVKIS